MKIKEPNFPPFNIPDAPIVSTSQNHIPIADIVDDLVLFKDGGAAIIMESTSLNFGLLSPNEQESVIVSYAALINSLSFTTQILVRTQKKDISQYLTYLDSEIAKIQIPKLKTLAEGYKKFISETIKKKNVLGKKFYIIIPFSPFELGFSKSTFPTLNKKKGPLPYSKSYILKKAKIVLFPKRDHVIRQASRMGLKLTQLKTDELINLYYNVYNPPKEMLATDTSVIEEIE